MKNKILLSCILFMIIRFTGCAEEETADAELSQDMEVTIVTFDENGSSLDGMLLAPVLMGDNLYFWMGSPKASHTTVSCRIMCWA